MQQTSKRTAALTVYSDPGCIHSHRVRLVLAEKGIHADIESGDTDDTLPRLVDRDLVLYDARVVVDYLDERYPHPPFMPIEPVARAKARLALLRIESDWYALVPFLEEGGEIAQTARHQLTESLTAAADVFAAMPFFLSEDFSMLDATLAPLLWRLSHYGIELPKAAASIDDYSKRLFERSGFQNSLTDREILMVRNP